MRRKRLKSERRSIERDTRGWLGMQKLQHYVSVCPTQLHQNMLITLFETGCRSSELIQLRREHFIWNDEAIFAKRILVLKRKRQVYRDFYIKRDKKNPLAEDFVDFLTESRGEFLFPGRQNGHTSRITLYRRISEVSPELWPHFLRSQKARFLTKIRGFNVIRLTEFFNWKSSDTALWYVGTRLKDQQEALGIKKVPGMI